MRNKRLLGAAVLAAALVTGMGASSAGALSLTGTQTDDGGIRTDFNDPVFKFCLITKPAGPETARCMDGLP